MSDARQVLEELLAIHRGHVASLEKQKALVRFDSSIELQLVEERRQIARIKRKLRRLKVRCDDDPLDGDWDDPPRERSLRAWHTDAAEPPVVAPRAAPARGYSQPAWHALWIGGLLLATLALAALVAWALRDALATAAVFVFTLLMLAMVLPYMGLQSGRLSQARWFRSYVAALRRIPGLDSLLRK